MRFAFYSSLSASFDLSPFLTYNRSHQMKARQSIVPVEQIEKSILLIRGQRVMLDSDLASLYKVSTKVFNQAVRRNRGRFPVDFMFRLSSEEFEILRYHFGTSNLRSQFVTSRWGGRRYLPYVFTEQGVAMLSSVLNSPRFLISPFVKRGRGGIFIPQSALRIPQLLFINRGSASPRVKRQANIRLKGKTIKASLTSKRQSKDLALGVITVSGGFRCDPGVNDSASGTRTSTAAKDRLHRSRKIRPVFNWP